MPAFDAVAIEKILFVENISFISAVSLTIHFTSVRFLAVLPLHFPVHENGYTLRNRRDGKSILVSICAADTKIRQKPRLFHAGEAKQRVVHLLRKISLNWYPEVVGLADVQGGGK
jgi:hypothetical protein